MAKDPPPPTADEIATAIELALAPNFARLERLMLIGIIHNYDSDELDSLLAELLD